MNVYIPKIIPFDDIVCEILPKIKIKESQLRLSHYMGWIEWNYKRKRWFFWSQESRVDMYVKITRKLTMFRLRKVITRKLFNSEIVKSVCALIPTILNIINAQYKNTNREVTEYNVHTSYIPQRLSNMDYSKNLSTDAQGRHAIVGRRKIESANVNKEDECSSSELLAEYQRIQFYFHLNTGFDILLELGTVEKFNEPCEMYLNFTEQVGKVIQQYWTRIVKNEV